MALRSLRKEFGVAIGAAETALRIDSDEIDDALKTLTEVAKEFGWELRVWDHTVGTVWYNGDPSSDAIPPTIKKPGGFPGMPGMSGLADALGHAPPQAPNPLQEVVKFLQEIPKPDKSAKGEVMPVILVMKNFHLAFETRDRGPLVSAIQHLISDKISDHPKYKDFEPTMIAHEIDKGNDTGKFLVGIMPAEAKLPPEVAPLFSVITHDYPDTEELVKILEGIIPASQDDEEELIDKTTRLKVAKFALGLTRLQAEGIFSKATVQFGNKKNFREILPKFVWKEKSAILNREGLVTLYDGKETFSDVVGQEGIKKLLPRLLAPDEYDPDNPDLRSKGVCLVGPPRTGKSLTVQASGNELGLPTLMCHPGNLMGSYVGDTEKNTRKFFQIVRAHAPCIAVIDEVEKVMPSGKGDSGDSGVGKRMAGTFMSQMQDIKEPVFWAFTANSVRELHEAFLDDDRIDVKVYVKMPGPAQLAKGWQLYLGKFFPQEVKGNLFPGYLNTNVAEVLNDLKKAKKVNPVVWANRLVAALMCVEKSKRGAFMAELKDIDENVYKTVKEAIFDDDGWTIARIKSVCRLSRRLKQPLSETAKMMPRTQSARVKAIQQLESWAAEEAIDAETGVAYSPVEEEEDDGDSVTQMAGLKRDPTRIKARRKVRKQDHDEE